MQPLPNPVLEFRAILVKILRLKARVTRVEFGADHTAAKQWDAYADCQGELERIMAERGILEFNNTVKTQ